MSPRRKGAGEGGRQEMEEIKISLCEHAPACANVRVSNCVVSASVCLHVSVSRRGCLSVCGHVNMCVCTYRYMFVSITACACA